MRDLMIWTCLMGMSGLALVASPGEAEKHLQDAVAAEDRLEEDRARDALRKPAEVLSFFGVQPGMNVVELMSGSGYYIDIIGRAVGPNGRAYAQNNDFVLKRFAEKNIANRLKNPNLANVSRIDRELDDLGLPSGLDAVLIILFYHDTYWQNVDREKMNRAVFEALKPGGIYGVVDHYAEDGSGSRDVKTIHRMDIALVKKELTDAGFELVAEQRR